jgi:hypothetical protein
MQVIAHMDQQFPLRTTFFRGPPLSEETQRHHAVIARENASALVQLAFNEQWRYVPPEKDGIQYRKDTSNLQESYRLIRSSVILKCKSNEVTTMVKHSGTENLRNFMKKFLPKTFIDAIIVNVISSPTNNNDEEEGLNIKDELITVKWGVIDIGLTVKRDMCLIDLIGETVVPNALEKEPLYIWCLTSIDGNNVGCMAMKDSHGISRAKVSKVGLLWRQINADDVEVIFCGSFKSKHAKSIGSTIINGVHHLSNILEELRFSYQKYAHRSTWVKDHDRTGCLLCMRNFHALRRKHHCRMCGELICSDCSIVKSVELPVIGLSKLRLCKICVVRAKSSPVGVTGGYSDDNCLDQERHRLTFSNDDSSSTSAIVSEREQCYEYDEYDNVETVAIKGMCSDTCRMSLTRLSLLQTEGEKEMATQWCEKLETYKPTIGSSESMFHLLCDLACETLNCPIAVVCLLDGQNNEKLKSEQGLENYALRSEIILFVQKVMANKPIVVLDANVDENTKNVFDHVPIIRFFAGCPIFGQNGTQIGYICVADIVKRTSLGANCAFTMERLANLAATTMEVRQKTESLPKQQPFVSKINNHIHSHKVNTTDHSSTAEIRMRDLLLKTYMTQQQIASTKSHPPPTRA